jgi:hypothetical protein
MRGVGPHDLLSAAQNSIEPNDIETTVQALLGRVADADHAVVGPWVAEVGFEVLYWIPFIRRLAAEAGLDSQRLTAVSRGGVGSWYAGICDDYSEIFDRVEVDEFRSRLEERWEQAGGGQKHMVVDAWDEELLRRTVDWDGAAPFLHPSLMYSSLRAGWRGRMRFSDLVGRLQFERWTPPRDEAIERLLPERYVAVKFYARPSFPNTPEARQFVSAFVTQLAEETPVVLLTSELTYDDHDDFDPAVAGRVVRLLDDVAPSANLRAQSVALAHADGFVGTYGGLVYLANAYGVPAVGYASRPEDYMAIHLDVGRHAAHALGTSLTVVDPRTAQPLRAAARLLEPVMA